MTVTARSVVLSFALIGLAAVAVDAIAHPKPSHVPNSSAHGAPVSLVRSDHSGDRHFPISNDGKNINCACFGGDLFEYFGASVGGAYGSPSLLGAGAGAAVGGGGAKLLHDGAHHVYEHRHEIPGAIGKALEHHDKVFRHHYDVTGETFFNGPKY